MAKSIDEHMANGVRFWGPAPVVDFSGRFPQIRELRAAYYHEVLSQRSPEQIEVFVGRLGLSEFMKPQKTARQGAIRNEPIAAAAIDTHTGQILAFAHGYSEISSSLPGPIAGLDRARKKHIVPAKHYFAFNEVVHDGTHDELPTALTGLLLAHVDVERTATWHPYQEEERLRADLQKWGFQPDRRESDLPAQTGRGEIITEEKIVFGDDATPAVQERWTVGVADLRDNIRELLKEETP